MAAEPVIVEAVRTPIGKRGGGLSTLHPAEVLSNVQRAIIERTGLDPNEVGQIVGGCVSQAVRAGFMDCSPAWVTVPPTICSTASAGMPVRPRSSRYVSPRR